MEVPNFSIYLHVIPTLLLLTYFDVRRRLNKVSKVKAFKNWDFVNNVGTANIYQFILPFRWVINQEEFLTPVSLSKDVFMHPVYYVKRQSSPLKQLPVLIQRQKVEFVTQYCCTSLFIKCPVCPHAPLIDMWNTVILWS